MKYRNTSSKATPSALNTLSRRAFLGTSSALVAALTVGLRTDRAFAATPQPGGVLRVGVIGTGAYGKIEPHVLNGDALQELMLSRTVFEPLTLLDPDGKVTYVLAESMTADDTQTIWTIKLRAGVVFHNGKPMGADDVIASLKRLAEPGTVTGSNLGPVEAYEKIDELTVKVTLAAPRNWLPEGLSDAYCGIVPVEFDAENPVGTGPFRYAATNLQQGVTLERFEGYHGAKAVVEKLEAVLFGDSTAAMNALTAGQIDIYAGLEPFLAAELESYPGFALYNSPTGRFMPIQMRTDTAPFDDARVRQALRLCIDRNAVLEAAWGGYASKGNDLYSTFDQDFASDLQRDQDLETARKLIEEAGVTGTTLELAMMNDMATALVLAENAKEIGLTINVTQLDGATFYGEEYFTRPFFGGDYYPSNPYFAISALCDGPNPSLDQVKWRDPEYLALWPEASGTSDMGLRSQKLRRLQEILFDRGAWIIPAFGNELAAYSLKLTGLPDHDGSGSGIYRALSKIGFTA